MTDRKQPEIKFVNFHGHSNASIFDGMGYPQEHLEYAYENGLEALALTDHGNMNNMVHQFLHSKKMKEQERYVKPIYGVEAYFLPSMQEWLIERNGEQVSDEENSATIIEDENSKAKADKKILNRRRHLVLLAKNQTGLYNIFSLISKSYQQPNFYRFPRMDYEMLKEHSEGIIATSACLGGVYAGDYWENKDNGPEAVLTAMRETSERMLEIFGDDWYGELQWNYIQEQHELNQFVIQVCEEYGIELVSTADAHYPRPELWKYRELYKRLGWRSSSEEELPASVKELGYALYPKNGDQMFKEYLRTSKELGFTYDHELVLDSIERTHEIAFSKIEDFQPNTDVRLPSFILDERSDPDLQLREISYTALKAKNREQNTKYVERLERELKVLKDTKFSKYFLAMNAVSKEAQTLQLTGPGRGSAGGSLIAYLLDITEIDPIRWETQFERFLRSDSKDMPDIDYDVEDPMEFKNYLIDKWGEFSVVPISTVSTLKMKSLIKSISKYYGVDFSAVNDITTVIDEQAIPKAKEKHGITAGVYNPTFEEYKEFSPALADFLEEYPEVEEPIQTIFKQPFAIGRHAGGVVISEDLNKFMPLISSKGVVQTPWSEGQNVRHLEPMGFIKFDLLGLTTLRMMRDCVSGILESQGIKPSFQEIKKFYRENLHIDNLDVNDPKVFDSVFKKGVFPSIFQFTKKNAQDFCVSVAPENLIDISIITSIYRPGPLSADVDKKYIDARKNADSIIYKHEKLKKITESTSGFLVFQEQISAIAHELGKDISLDDANQLRKVLTKKGTGKEDKVKTSLYNRFIEGCIENGLSEDDGKKFWEDMEFFSGYGFNKSHAIAYSLISYQCAWLFTYYPDQWFVAILNNADEKFVNMNIAKSLGYKIEKPNINHSGEKWTCKDGRLFQPLTDIKGLGPSAVEEILVKRPFESLEDIFFNKGVLKSKLKKSNLEAMAKVGALDDLYDENLYASKAHFIKVCTTGGKNAKTFKQEIESAENRELPEISEDERINNIFSLTKDYPLELVVDEEILRELIDEGVNPVSDYDKDRPHWFVVTGYAERKTKKGKVYWLIEGIDSGYEPFNIKVWSVYPERDTLNLNKLYIIKKGCLEKDDKWGLSTGHKSPFCKTFVCVS